jgi:hypothetical protein
MAVRCPLSDAAHLRRVPGFLDAAPRSGVECDVPSASPLILQVCA